MKRFLAVIVLAGCAPAPQPAPAPAPKSSHRMAWSFAEKDVLEFTLKSHVSARLISDGCPERSVFDVEIEGEILVERVEKSGNASGRMRFTKMEGKYSTSKATVRLPPRGPASPIDVPCRITARGDLGVPMPLALEYNIDWSENFRGLFVVLPDGDDAGWIADRRGLPVPVRASSQPDGRVRIEGSGPSGGTLVAVFDPAEGVVVSVEEDLAFEETGKRDGEPVRWQRELRRTLTVRRKK